ncbi:MAG: DUF2946 family protein [Pseudomonadota bacterium]|nr:DUF2946 family protein [Pseudomonadota bacterium]
MYRALHLRLFAPVALAAILLLALVPTAGRLVTGAGQSATAAADSSEVAGAQVTAPDTNHAAHAAAAGPSSSPRSPSGEHDGHDCAYCPLLTSTVSLQVPTIQLSALQAAVPVPSRALHERPAAARIPGLGSRGPPRLVQG